MFSGKHTILWKHSVREFNHLSVTSHYLFPQSVVVFVADIAYVQKVQVILI